MPKKFKFKPGISVSGLNDSYVFVILDIKKDVVVFLDEDSQTIAEENKAFFKDYYINKVSGKSQYKYGGKRKDGFYFYFHKETEVLFAGCHQFESLEEALEHWDNSNWDRSQGYSPKEFRQRLEFNKWSRAVARKMFGKKRKKK